MKTIAFLSTITLTLGSVALPKPAQAAPEDFIVRQSDISDVRELSKYGFGKYQVSDAVIARGLQTVCGTYQTGRSEEEILQIYRTELGSNDTLSSQAKTQIRDFLITVHAVAVTSICPEYRQNR